ncbi:MAG: hypothetical protein PHF84_04205 [bacterium]|nr:hypothetical protein [bacterium]
MKKAYLFFVIFLCLAAEASPSGLFTFRNKYYFSDILGTDLLLESPLKYFRLGADIKYMVNYEDELPYQYLSGAVYQKWGKQVFFFSIGAGVSYAYNEILRYASGYLYLDMALPRFVKAIPLGFQMDMQVFSDSMNLFPDLFFQFDVFNDLKINMGSSSLLILDYSDKPVFRTGVYWGIAYAF